MSNYQTVDTCQINEQTYTAFKDSLIRVIADEIENRFELIGGPGLVIQVDETAVCRGRVITDPSNTLDFILNTTWLVGGIKEGSQNIFLKIVPNRQTTTITSIFRQKVNTGGVI
ncbi:hypothetical protein DMUE_6391 [Dictyocoela muelleri]|nr:hypothetical protein DMUE_6391 [Dictyocoela muelleri]